MFRRKISNPTENSHLVFEISIELLISVIWYVEVDIKSIPTY